LHDGELVFTIEEDWIVGGRTWKAGSLLSMPASQATSPKPAVRLVYEPGPRDSIDEVEVTRAGLLVATYSNVRGRVLQARFTEGAWRVSPVPLPDSGSVSLQAADPNGGTAFAVYQGFLQPSSLY